MTYSITKNGKPLNKKLYTICEKTRTFSSDEDGLILDFSGENGWTFITGSFCTFKTGSECIFNTGWKCLFNTGSRCCFSIGSYCTSNTGSFCIFNTGLGCTFTTNNGCTFNTGWECTFKTGGDCTFKTGSGCTFKTGDNCIIMSCLKETKMLLIKTPTEFKCTETEFLFKVGGEYVTQTEYEMYKELIS